MGKNDDFVVDTKNLCFLCYRPAKIIAAGVKGRVKDKTFSLRGISRFMDVDFQEMIKPAFPTPMKEGDGKFPQVLVTVCSRCSAVTEEFATLYQYMEFTQMKINACVRNMNELMKKTESNTRLVDMFRKKMKTSGGVQGEIVENMRKKMMENCASTLKKAFPRVKLKKYGEKVQTTKRIGGAKAKPGPRSKKPEFSSTILKTDSLNLKYPSLKKETENLSPEKNEGGGLFQCLHCDNTFKDTNGLRTHIVRYHREQFFAMFKSSTISDEDFKVAVELLFQDVRKITANSGNQSTVSFVCSFCGKPFAAKIDTYVHMVQLHHDVLSTKLQNIQKDASLIASAKNTLQLPDPASLQKRRKVRGPYKKKNKNLVVGLENGLKKSTGNSSNTSRRKPIQSFQNSFLTIGKNPVGFPRTCECGAQLSSRSSWNNHQRLHCKLKIGATSKMKNVPPAPMQHPLLKKAKNTVGFPRTCGCGVRISLKSSWINHQKMHCKLKFGGAPNVSPSVFDNAVNQVIKTAVKTKKKGKGRPSRSVVALKTKTKQIDDKKTKYACECGSVLGSYSSWYYHKNRGCKLNSEGMTDSLDLDIVEEVPIDITPSGDICLPSGSTSIETSPVPKIMKVTSRGGVIKGLQNMASLQGILKKEEVSVSTSTPETNSQYLELFMKYFPVGIPADKIKESLQKVLQEYRKFPGSISGCPFCGRGFSQVAEIQHHMVESHFDEVLNKLKGLVCPLGSLSNDDDGVINMDPSLVKSENENEMDVPSDDLYAGDLHQSGGDLQPGYFEQNDFVPKDEVVYELDPESTTNDADEEDPSLLILP